MDTDTDTVIGMHLSCNFVNVYTIAYHVQYTFTRVQARIPNGQTCKDTCQEKRSVESEDKSARISMSCMFLFKLL